MCDTIRRGSLGDSQEGTTMRTPLTALVLIGMCACGSAGAARGPTPAATTSPASTVAPAPTPSDPIGAPSETASAPTTAAFTPSPTAAGTCSNASALSTWSVTRLAEQTVVVPVDEGHVASVTPEVAAGAGGMILFGTSAPATLAADLHRLSAVAPNGVKPFVMTDEEGGDIQRMANLVGSIPSARKMGATMTPAQIHDLALGLARRLRAAGVTMDLAPVLDVDGGQGPNDRNPDGRRSFSEDQRIAAADGLAFAAGLRAGGIVAVVKHFPGLGGATGNTDVTRASTPPWSTLQRNGLVPFQDAVDARVPAVMIANASVPGLTDLPASVSPAAITTVLRDRLGYQGLVITDSLSAIALSAIGYSVPAAAVAAIEAGADLVLYDAHPAEMAPLTNQVVAALVSAVGSGKLDRGRLVSAVAHILTAKGVDLCAAA